MRCCPKKRAPSAAAALTAAVAAACAAALLVAIPAPPAAAEPNVGLAVGEKAPDFSLVDQAGTTRSLGSLLGRGTLAIVFHRSADW